MIYLVLERIDLGDHVIAAHRSERAAREACERLNAVCLAMYPAQAPVFHVEEVQLEE